MNTLTARRTDTPRPQVPSGQRVYAVGDIHGRLDLLLPLLAHIRDDIAARSDADNHVVLLGDLVDRGPYSAETVEYAISGLPSFATFHVLMGNHEEAMLRALDPQDDQSQNLWLKFGGYETLASYGVPVATLGEELPPPETLRHYIPERHRQFLETLPDAIRFGDYVLVHAGVRPGVSLEEQNPQDMRWIRREFLDHKGDHGAFIVHGHSISTEPDVQANRVGIDTGAYRSGTLTALGLEGDRRWLLRASVIDGEVQTKLSSLG
ncbi:MULTISPECIES: metallophosphoesterase [unclassified Sphingomonas]|uniref:metallophosphoesterase n=1 Tax=unclassified Sphingomonas TaxID=196159 RepID=UPI00070046A8|nr:MULTISPECIES: metallophosphoesterase [unclassified Sphingomonas]KQX17851.1 metallophosphoesterase [Sphingomonas sp. Root1294]KQY70777.1 metallophosphoesterase [Sphingomonas sp. Root50]KRB91730.1 metallophosphoesterase [Sphingomonas sp. Root720]